MTQIVLVTGMSGAGRTTALKVLEDLGFEAVDNLPVTLLGSLVRPGDRLERRLAIGMDCRTRAFDPDALAAILDALEEAADPEVQLLFLDCENEVLRRRFTETRRPHPLAGDRPVMDGIAGERQLIEPLRARADLVIDTSSLATKDLRQLLLGHFATERDQPLVVSMISFGYRNGLPREADLVFDVRFLSNPHYVDELRPLTGCDPEVRAYIERDPGYDFLLARLTALVEPLLPAYQREGKSYLTIAFGCTGGRHRSIAVAEAFAGALRQAGWPVLVQHRDTPDAAAGRQPGGPAAVGGAAE